MTNDFENIAISRKRRRLSEILKVAGKYGNRHEKMYEWQETYATGKNSRVIGRI